MKKDVKPFQQKLLRFHPSLKPLIKKELKKILNAKIIIQVKHSAWAANLVPINKKSGENCLCVDFHNLNKASGKYS